MLGSYLAGWLGGENISHLRVQFRGQAWPGDSLTYQATVAGKREDDGQKHVDLDVRVTTSRDILHLVGVATFAVPD